MTGIYLADIFEYLSGYPTTLHISNEALSRIRCSKLFTQPMSRIEPDVLYFCRMSDLMATSALPDYTNVCCCLDVSPPEEMSWFSRLNSIVCSDSTLSAQLSNGLQDFFSSALYAAQSAVSIFTPLLTGDGVQGVVDAAYEALGRHIVVCDNLGTVIAHTAPDIPGSAPEWRSFIAKGYAPALAGGTQNYVSSVTPVSMGQQLQIAENVDHGVQNAIAEINLHGRTLARMSILLDSGGLSPEDVKIVSSLISALLLRLGDGFSTPVRRGTGYEAALIKLLECRTSIPEHIRVLAGQLSLRTEGYFAFFVFDLVDQRPFDTGLAGIIAGIESCFKTCRAVNYDGRIVALVDFGEQESFSAHDYSALVDYIARYELHCGMSRPFARLEALQLYYIQAVDCSELCKYTKLVDNPVTSGDVNYYERCEPFLFIHKAVECGMDVQRYVHPFAQTLDDHDRTHDTEYAKTLYYYIRCAQKAQPTADALYIHRNTLDYRLKKIQELAPFLLTDGDVLARLYYSLITVMYLKMRRLREHD